MAIGEKVDNTLYIAMTRSEAVHVIGLLVAQLAGVGLSKWHGVGAAPDLFVREPHDANVPGRETRLVLGVGDE